MPHDPKDQPDTTDQTQDEQQSDQENAPKEESPGFEFRDWAMI